MYLLDLATALTRVSKLFLGKRRTERSRNTVLVTSTQVHYLSLYSTVQGVHFTEFIRWVTTAENSCAAATSRVACSSVAASCTYVSAINASSVSSIFVVCNRCKTLTGSLDPTSMQPANKPCSRGIHITLHIPWDSPLVRHLPTSRWPAWQQSHLFHILARH